MKSIFDTDSLTAFLKEHKILSFRAKQIYTDIFQHSILEFDQMITLPKEVRSMLSDYFYIIPFELDSIHEGTDSTKIWFKLEDGSIIESVIMYHYHDFPHRHLNRVTLCISSQVWCPVWCIFCVTGKLGFGKNLWYDVMVGQILWVNNYLKTKLGKKEDGTTRKVRNIVFMGMGEPLLNYDNMKTTIQYALWQNYLWLSKRHVTISTSGIIPGILKLIDDDIDCKLALSLHAPNQSLREKLIPTISKAYTLNKLMDAIDKYTDHTNNRVFYEYIMIDGMTDWLDTAEELVDLLKDRNAHVNLIPYNPNPAMPDLKESSSVQIAAFRDILERGWLTVTTRDNHGRKIKWACGQLWYEKIAKKWV